MKTFVYRVPGTSDKDSVPLGNGDIGITLWGEAGGRICMYISKTDSFSEDLRLLKIGRVDIEPDLPYDFCRFKLDLEHGTATVSYDRGKDRLTYMIWVDAGNPCIKVTARCTTGIRLGIRAHVWRTEDDVPDHATEQGRMAYRDFAGQNPEAEGVRVSKDILCGSFEDAVLFYHRNERSCYLDSLKHQGIGDLAGLYPDPLLHRTFGACLMASGAKKPDALTLESPGMKEHDVTIGVLTLVEKDETLFPASLHRLTDACHRNNTQDILKKHRAWWKSFHTSSFIEVRGDKRAKAVSTGYKVQRYMTACAGRGAFPIKFNGSIFTIQIPEKGYDMGPDYRRWGGPYWFQNTRLIYWTMLASGDYAMMKPFFNMYVDSYEISKAKTMKYFGFEGLCYPETMTPWTTHRNSDWGFHRDGATPGIAVNPYIRTYFSGMLELLVLMMEYVRHTEDMDFGKDVLLKFAKGILGFYRSMYPEKDENGKMVIYPSMALETWQDAKNPTDALAGLLYATEQLLRMDIADEETRVAWEGFWQEIPEIPCFVTGGSGNPGTPAKIKPAYIYDKLGNVENPELYAVFPYRLYSFEKENINIGRETYVRRELRNNFGWTQDGIQAAVLGLAGEAMKFVTDKFSVWHGECRFPGYWGPNYDWIPDQDHGCSASIALQKMLIQCVEDKIYLFPAWPEKWDVRFKLHAYHMTVVEGEIRGGRLVHLHVEPEHRCGDVVLPEGMVFTG